MIDVSIESYLSKIRDNNQSVQLFRNLMVTILRKPIRGYRDVCSVRVGIVTGYRHCVDPLSFEWFEFIAEILAITKMYVYSLELSLLYISAYDAWSLPVCNRRVPFHAAHRRQNVIDYG
jgi:hypothetical protein